jgi:hypothetical protein
MTVRRCGRGLKRTAWPKGRSLKFGGGAPHVCVGANTWFQAVLMGSVMADSAEFPFVAIGNRRCLAAKQLKEQPWLGEFVVRFHRCFRFDPLADVFWLSEED